MASTVFANEKPFMIEVAEDKLCFVHTQRSRAALGALIGAGLVALLTINGVVQLAMAQVGAGLVLFGLTAALLAVTVVIWRRRRPPRTRVVTLDGGGLRDPDDNVLAQRSELSVRVGIDWTDGMGGVRLARQISLHWPRGRLQIYKTYDKEELARVRRCLVDRGIG